MRSPSLIINQIKHDFACYTFVEGDDFIWSPLTNSVGYCTPKTIADIWTLLHEIAHAELEHTGYDYDVDLIKHESQAWAYAQTVLAPLYGLKIDEDHIQDHLDTYRVWLHERSMCPDCGQNSLQTTKNTYECQNCRCSWRANEARICRLKRTKLQVRGHSS